MNWTTLQVTLLGLSTFLAFHRWRLSHQQRGYPLNFCLFGATGVALMSDLRAHLGMPHAPSELFQAVSILFLAQGFQWETLGNKKWLRGFLIGNVLLICLMIVFLTAHLVMVEKVCTITITVVSALAAILMWSYRLPDARQVLLLTRKQTLETSNTLGFAFTAIAIHSWIPSALWQDLFLLLAFLLIARACYRLVLIEHFRLEDEIHKLSKEKEGVVSFLKEMGVAVSEGFQLDAVLTVIMEDALQHTEAGAGTIFLFDDRKVELIPRLSDKFLPPLHSMIDHGKFVMGSNRVLETYFGRTYQADEGLVGKTVQGRQSLLIDDVRRENILAPEVVDSLHNRSMVLVPLGMESEVLGVMAFANKHSRFPFTSQDQSYLEALAYQAAFSINSARLYQVLAQKERMEREMQIARDIQHLLLPDQYPQISGFDIAALSRSALEVGGDYYDFISAGEDRLGIAIADVSGKGIPGALTMAMVRSTLRAAALDSESPREVLSQVNKTVFPDLRQDMFISLLYLFLDPERRTVTFCRAGHEPLIHISNQGHHCKLMVPEGIAIGIDSGPLFKSQLQEIELAVEPGDLFVFYTDGVTEAMNKDREEFGQERLLKLLTENTDQEVSQLLERLDQEVCHFTGNRPQHDDLTMVLLKAR